MLLGLRQQVITNGLSSEKMDSHMAGSSYDVPVAIVGNRLSYQISNPEGWVGFLCLMAYQPLWVI